MALLRHSFPQCLMISVFHGLRPRSTFGEVGHFRVLDGHKLGRGHGQASGCLQSSRQESECYLGIHHHIFTHQHTFQPTAAVGWGASGYKKIESIFGKYAPVLLNSGLRPPPCASLIVSTLYFIGA